MARPAQQQGQAGSRAEGASTKKSSGYKHPYKWACGYAPATPTDAHPWIVDAVRKSTHYTVNPARPLLFALTEGRTVRLGKCTPDVFMKGDVLVVTFTVSVAISDRNWRPQHCPIELVRGVCIGIHLMGDIGLPTTVFHTQRDMIVRTGFVH